MGLTARDVNGALEFGKEFTRLADTVHRQFTLALGDCHFERDVCSLFKPKNIPVLFLFKANKIYELSATDATYESLLDFLSSDNYLRQSTVFEENADDFIRAAIGTGGGFADRLYHSYGKAFQTYFQDLSKRVFKSLHLGHWNQMVQVGLLMIAILSPIVFIITVLVAKIFVLIYNYVCKRSYDKKIENLTVKKEALERELAKISGKKKD